MKISAATDLPTNFSAKSLNPTPDSDLPPKRYIRKPTRRKPRNASSSDAGTRLRRDGASAGKKTGPATPLLKWKVDDRDKALDLSAKAERSPQQVRKVRKGGEAVISARKLAAGIWRLRLPEVPSAGNEKCSLRQEEDQPRSFQVTPQFGFVAQDLFFPLLFLFRGKRGGVGRGGVWLVFLGMYLDSTLFVELFPEVPRK